MITPVKFITSEMRGAPVLSGLAGTLLSVIDSLTQTGWGAVPALSATVSGGVATINLSAGESFDVHATVLISGATPSTLNGEARVLSSTDTQITVATTAADGVASGAIAVKYAPHTSWTKQFGATNKGMYKSNDPQAFGRSFLINDTTAQSARIRGYDVGTSISGGTGPFPTTSEIGGAGMYLHKSVSADATPVRYTLACDSRFMFIHVECSSFSGPSYFGGFTRGFGDLIHLSIGLDTWASCVGASGTDDTVLGSFSHSGITGLAPYGGFFFPRARSGVGSAVGASRGPYCGTKSSHSGMDDLMGTAPSEVDGTIRFSKSFLADLGSLKPPRADVPGLYHVPQYNLHEILKSMDTVDGTGDLAGRKLMCLVGRSSAYSPVTGGSLLDLTGPWR